MNYKPLGNSNLSASVVGLGAWVLGGGQVWGRDTDDAESIRAIQKAIDLGINLIDTAPAYGYGRSEAVVGKAIKGRRDRVLIATKGGLWWEDTRGSFFTDLDGKKVYRSLRPDTLRVEVENSLRRLGVDCIDLYQTHWPSMPPDATPIADTMATLLGFKDQGKIRALGVCNVSVAELGENIRCGHVVSDQFRYSMLNRDAEKDILPFCAQNNLATLTYMSLEQGLLTGKIGMDRVFQPGEFRANEAWNAWLMPVNRRRVLDLLARWKELTDKYQCTLAQLVIAWTAAQAGVTHVLAGGRNIEQVTENARAGDLNLAPEDIKRIRDDVTALGQPAKD
ncbi:MAG TPA: aldo/keto reductase [Verrucomicrobiota bacterium]|jgi:methylglyoxal reductase|nr:aldo/keto reductase [Verrucomicrobiota bacterium]HQL78538.1 aldo/keto reductase [Verrucomicrobiota bacterium]